MSKPPLSNKSAKLKSIEFLIEKEIVQLALIRTHARRVTNVWPFPKSKLCDFQPYAYMYKVENYTLGLLILAR